MTAQFTPVSNLPSLYMNKLVLSYLTTTTLSVGVGQCRDSNNVMDLVVSATLTINGAVNGANGLDTGSLAASTWYYIYVIGDSSAFNPAAALVSLSATAPTLPTGYDSFRMIGANVTNSSSQFTNFYQADGLDSNVRTFWYDSMPTLFTGNATSFTSTSVAAGIPPLAYTVGLFSVSYTGATAANTVNFRVTGSSATSGIPGVACSVATVVVLAEITSLTVVTSGSAKIDYKVTNGSDSVSVSAKAFTLSL